MEVRLESGLIKFKVSGSKGWREIGRRELSEKLSAKLPSAEAIILLCRLPYIEKMVYRKNEKSLSYSDHNENQETMSDISENIAEIFDKYDC